MCLPLDCTLGCTCAPAADDLAMLLPPFGVLQVQDSRSVSQQLQDWCDAQQTAAAAAEQDSQRARDQCASRKPTQSSSAKRPVDKQKRPSSQPSTRNSSSRRTGLTVAEAQGEKTATPNNSSAHVSRPVVQGEQLATPNGSSRRTSMAQQYSRVKTPNSSSSKVGSARSGRPVGSGMD